MNIIKASSHCPICGYDRPHNHSMQDRWIGVDFDGTLAYTIPNRQDPYELGEPIPEMINRVRDWLARGYTVKLLTARMFPRSHTGIDRDVNTMDKILKSWTLRYVGVALENTCMKDGWMEVLWDDRAVHAVKDTGMASWMITCECLSIGPDYCLVHSA